MQELKSKVVALEKKVTTSLGNTSAQAMDAGAAAASSSAGASAPGNLTLAELEKKVTGKFTHLILDLSCILSY